MYRLRPLTYVGNNLCACLKLLATAVQVATICTSAYLFYVPVPDSLDNLDCQLL